MTIESARALYQKVIEDADFRASFEAVSTEEEKKHFIKDAGYNFTSDEWQQMLTEVQAANSSQELSEEELEAVAGGVNIDFKQWYRTAASIGLATNINFD